MIVYAVVEKESYCDYAIIYIEGTREACEVFIEKKCASNDYEKEYCIATYTLGKEVSAEHMWLEYKQ